MNGSHKCGFIWWGTAGCASRTTSVFLYQCGCDDFMNVMENKRICVDGSHTHAQGIPEGYENYPIICNMRNPYSKCVSSYLDETADEGHHSHNMEFKEWLLQLTSDDMKNSNYDHYYISEWDKIGRRPDYLIRMENMEEDVKKIPMIPKNDMFEIALNGIRKNTYKSENTRDEYRGEFQYFQKYYDQETADIVYHNHKEYFELGGYDKDSWKL